MTAFIIKSGICMVLFFGLYWILLRKEKLFAFNRFYLIFSVLFSLAIPFISFSVNLGNTSTARNILTRLNYPIETSTQRINISPSGQETISPVSSVDASFSQPAISEPIKTDYTPILVFIYIAGCTMMLIRFCRNLILLNKVRLNSEKIDHGWFQIALLNNPANPFSFLRTIYLNKAEYLENRIADNVLRHEMEHVKQSHSSDVIFFETLHIIFWFNPVLFLYKSAARINHEYLADEAVVKSTSDSDNYANELISFIRHRTTVPFTSGFSPSMIRLRLLMLNTNSTRLNKNIRIAGTIMTSVLLMSVLSVQPAYPDSQNSKIKNRSTSNNKDIVIDEVYFSSQDFIPQGALFVMDGRKLGIDEVISFDPNKIKTIDILNGRKAVRKYGRSAENGVVEVSTYDIDKKSEADSLKFKPVYTLNEKIPEGVITIPVSNLYSFRIWTYPVFPNQDLRKRWRTIEIMTRDYYRISGKVIQDDGQPLAGVLLTIKDSPSKVLTDKGGRFSLNDVKPGSEAELSSEGYESLNFKVKGAVFTSDLNITLDNKNEHVFDTISKYKLKDFSGTWKINHEKTLELNKGFFKVVPIQRLSYVYTIRQYGSDSIVMNIKGIFEKNKEYENKEQYVLNTVKRNESAFQDNLKILVSCSVAPEGQSFSVTTSVKSIVGLSRDYKYTISYSLNGDDNQLLIRWYDDNDGSFPEGKLVEILAFDRM